MTLDQHLELAECLFLVPHLVHQGVHISQVRRRVGVREDLFFCHCHIDFLEGANLEQLLYQARVSLAANKDAQNLCIEEQVNLVSSESMSLEHLHLREFFARDVGVADGVDLRMEHRKHFFGAHHVHLVCQICDLVQIRIVSRSVIVGRSHERLQQTKHIQHKVREDFWQLAGSRGSVRPLGESCLSSAEDLERHFKLVLHRCEIMLIDLETTESTASPEESQSS